MPNVGNGHSAGNFARVVAAHAVSQDGHLGFLIDSHGVFIVGAHAPRSVWAKIRKSWIGKRVIPQGQPQAWMLGFVAVGAPAPWFCQQHVLLCRGAVWIIDDCRSYFANTLLQSVVHGVRERLRQLRTCLVTVLGRLFNALATSVATASGKSGRSVRTSGAGT